MTSLTRTGICFLASVLVTSSQESWRFTGDNVALNKVAEQGPGTYYVYDADRAVDGNTDTSTSNGHCSVTTRRYNTAAYWSVNLVSMYTLKGIRLYNQNNNIERLGNFKIIGYPSGTILYDDETANLQLYHKEVVDIPVNLTTAFSNITVLVPAHAGWPDNGYSQLTLCEVEIYAGSGEPVDGGWTDWSVWTSCSVTCGSGLITKTRTCTNPAPQYNGADCSGDDTDETTCVLGICPIDGGWSDWSSWTSCSVTCGSGPITRTRTCTNPVPQIGGADCTGDATDVGNCFSDSCPIDGGWTDWSAWTSCSATCGRGEITRTRTCTSPAPQNNGADCSGNATEQTICVHGNCPIDGGWTEWSVWTSCSVACGTGEINRTRTCTNPAPQYNGTDCSGDTTDEKTCVLDNCTSESSPILSEGTTDKSSVAPLAAGAGVGGVVAIAAVVGIVFLVVYRRRRRRGDPYSVPDTTYENHVCYRDLQNELNEKEEKREEKKIKEQMEDKNVKAQKEEKKGEKNVKAQKEEKWEEKRVNAQKEDKGEEKKVKAQKEEKKEEKKVKEKKEEKQEEKTVKEKKEEKQEEKTVKEKKEEKQEEKKVKEKKEEKQEEKNVKAQNKEKNEEKKVKVQKDENKEEKNVVEPNEEKREEKMSVVVQEEIIHEEKGDTYYSFAEKSELPETAIKVEDLPDVVFGGDVSSKRFSTEFKAFPEGMTKAHEKALVNRNKNRYKHIYAYDETRVVLDIWDEGKDTDYINACYIHGFTKPKAYIASQGVTLENMEDFWRMVWQSNSKTIVMLTKLYEEDKVKCLQYWPNEEPVTHGHITVSLESTEPFCNFIIRTLLVEKSGEPQRWIQHFHFTTWPDRDVPAFCSSFVHFRNKVKTATSPLDGPVIVHCSAGIGRTGTFIAIDYLTDQGKEMGCVDAVRCVETLRRQRVEMVQKETQYVFIHQALVEILLLKTSVVSTSEFAESYQDLLEHENGKRKLDEQFELLQKLSPKTDEQIAEKNVQYMQSLSGPGRTRDNVYINATFLPMYRENDAMIITQTPLETSKEYFWKLVYHQQVHTVVMMDHIPQLEDTAIYWPDAGDTDTVGEITVLNKNVDQMKGHSVLQLAVSIEDEEHQIQLIQFSAWDDDNPLPDSPTHILTCLELVADNQRKFGNKPILVHCMDGVERSGLFCVIAALMDRTKIEQDVAISQVIQEMRNRRGNVVPSVEQFQFCHEVVLEFLQQF